MLTLAWPVSPQVRLPQEALSDVRVLAAEDLFDVLELCLLSDRRTCWLRADVAASCCCRSRLATTSRRFA